ncbi:MAG: A/G-specific adenine glycosylase [Acidobacteria bacterium]|nr:A/G-specific adenine glycosylase [Acidobacteriota bacterium]
MPFEPDQIASFRRQLLDWYDQTKRDLPWRQTSDPYLIWVSEIMLQQTQVSRVVEYFTRFTEHFPMVEALATAEIDDVLKQWEGLGYYSRARSLHQAAQKVVTDHGGKLPATYGGLLKLPGFGPYTAAAVASIAFGEAVAAVDGNVNRVIARLTNFHESIKSAKALAHIRQDAGQLLDLEQPGDFNQALMELGATACRPGVPLCLVCPVAAHCAARKAGTAAQLPIRPAAVVRPAVQAACGIVVHQGNRLMIHRDQQRLLGGLWEFPGGRCRPDEAPESACRRHFQEKLGLEISVGNHLVSVNHTFTHFQVTLHAFYCQINLGELSVSNCQWVPLGKASSLALTRTARKILEFLEKQS